MHQAVPQVLHCWLGVWELNDDVEQLLNPGLGVGVLEVLQQLLPADPSHQGLLQPGQHHHHVQPLLQAGQVAATTCKSPGHDW